MKRRMRFWMGILAGIGLCLAQQPPERPQTAPRLELPGLQIPDAEIAAAYEKAATQNVLAAVNPKVFPGYWSVCADGQGFGYGNTYPSLDGHQMTDALLWLGQVEAVKANWNYVRGFQRPNGLLPLAILPSRAGQKIGSGDMLSPVAANGGLYRHWVAGDPLRALAAPTYIQNADVIYRYTQDRDWLLKQLPSVNLAAESLASLTTEDGAVGGAGYYVERPTRIEHDGVSQGHAVDAFRRAAELNKIAGNAEAARRCELLAGRVAGHFQKRFWVKDHFAEYIHPERGVIARHGLTDVDWSAIATGVATAEQRALLWPRLKDEKKFYYGGMPTGIATLPGSYESWEFTHDDRMDLAAMGRVWYLESWARARMGDGPGLLGSIRRVAQVGRESGYYWRERYNDQGGYGAEKYCEYPANLIRIVQRFVLGVEHRLDGGLALAPTVPEEFWEAGFGQTLSWRGRRLSYRMQREGIEGDYSGQASQPLWVRLHKRPTESTRLVINGREAESRIEDGWLVVLLPAADPAKPCHFEIQQ